MSQMKIASVVNTTKTFHRLVVIKTSAPTHNRIYQLKLPSQNPLLRHLVKLTEEEVTDTKIESIQLECKVKKTIKGST